MENPKVVLNKGNLQYLLNYSLILLDSNNWRTHLSFLGENSTVKLC